jgi:hypothetical protein
MPDGKGRRAVRGMVVWGINLKTPFPIPLTIIPLTLDATKGIEPRILRFKEFLTSNDPLGSGAMPAARTGRRGAASLPQTIRSAAGRCQNPQAGRLRYGIFDRACKGEL